MPYVPCPTCGLRTYSIGGEECPVCGTPLGRRSRVGSRPREWSDAAGSGPIEELLSDARHELRMDAALLSEARDGIEIVRWAVSNGRVPAARDISVPLADTICRHLLEGTISSVVCDTGGVAALRDLPLVREAGIGSYVGVEVRVPGQGRFVLCCVASDARPDLGDDDVRFLDVLAEQLRPVLGRSVRPA
ncbi:MAG: hypothetical protein QOJ21_751 [Solirubrobacteraceae bacterium]|nr:hypothetical protein [Solirubrobacteraceae bacterium]